MFEIYGTGGIRLDNHFPLLYINLQNRSQCENNIAPTSAVLNCTKIFGWQLVGSGLESQLTNGISHQAPACIRSIFICWQLQHPSLLASNLYDYIIKELCDLYGDEG